jgi:hypothetical protein
MLYYDKLLLCEIIPRLERTLRYLPVVVLSCLRQSGKSMLFQNEPNLARCHRYHMRGDFAMSG